MADLLAWWGSRMAASFQSWDFFQDGVLNSKSESGSLQKLPFNVEKRVIWPLGGWRSSFLHKQPSMCLRCFRGSSKMMPCDGCKALLA